MLKYPKTCRSFYLSFNACRLSPGQREEEAKSLTLSEILSWSQSTEQTLAHLVETVNQPRVKKTIQNALRHHKLNSGEIECAAVLVCLISVNPTLQKTVRPLWASQSYFDEFLAKAKPVWLALNSWTMLRTPYVDTLFTSWSTDCLLISKYTNKCQSALDVMLEKEEKKERKERKERKENLCSTSSCVFHILYNFVLKKKKKKRVDRKQIYESLDLKDLTRSCCPQCLPESKHQSLRPQLHIFLLKLLAIACCLQAKFFSTALVENFSTCLLDSEQTDTIIWKLVHLDILEVIPKTRFLMRSKWERYGAYPGSPKFLKALVSLMFRIVLQPPQKTSISQLL